MTVGVQCDITVTLQYDKRAEKARESGIEIREGVTVKNVDVQPDSASVITDQGNFRARIVVGADGSNGVTRRCILPHDPVHTARVLEILTPASEESRARVAFFVFLPVPNNIAGYVWDFPT